MGLQFNSMEIFRSIFSLKPEPVCQHPSRGVRISVASINTKKEQEVEERMLYAGQRLASQIHEEFVEDFNRSVADPSFEGPTNEKVMKSMTAEEIANGISEGIKQWEHVFFPST